MNEKKYIAAIEISSSKIIGTVGRYNNGILDVIAVEQEKMVECVKYGIIQNIEEANNHICRIIQKLESRPEVSPRKITSVFIGLSGRSIRNVRLDVNKNKPIGTEITANIINDMKEDAMRASIDNTLQIIDAVPRSYFIDKNETRNPVGTIGSSITAVFDLIVCRPILKNNITRVFDKNDIEIKGMIVTPIAVADMVLTQEEKRLGCMLVDFGAETTTISIYTDDKLNYLATIPLGSRNITRDLTSLNILEGKAEEYKTTIGNAIATEKTQTLKVDNIKGSDISNIVVARSEEIVANIIEQISYAQIKDNQLPGGIVVVGGGFNLNGMIKLLEQQSSMKVRRASLPPYVILEDTKAPAFESIEVISILKAGAESAGDTECLKAPIRNEVPAFDQSYTYEEEEQNERQEKREREQKRKETKSLLGKLKIGIGKMFDSKDDDDTELE